MIVIFAYILIYIYIYIYVCKMGCVLHKKAYALRLQEAFAPWCALMRLAPFTTMLVILKGLSLITFNKIHPRIWMRSDTQ